MYDNCSANDCPVNARVDRIEKEMDRYRDGSSKTHKEIFDRLNALEQDKTALATRLEGMDGKLDKLVKWREDQDDKPNKFLDKLKENAVNYIMLAMLGLMLLKMGIGA